MKKVLIICILVFTTMNTQAKNYNKQIAFAAVQRFFNVKKQRQVYEGRFVETDLAYGQVCKIIVDFSNPGDEFLTLVGEYTPATSVGDGIYFNDEQSRFQQVESKSDYLSIEQAYSDSFSTGMKTTVEMSRSNHILEFKLYKVSRFLLFSDTVEKKCLVYGFSTDDPIKISQ